MLLRPDGRRALIDAPAGTASGQVAAHPYLEKLAWQSIPGSSDAWPRPA
ncbi:hypothetical protein BURCENBC7_AP3086 [Burkholderia cenocepacia BC7]|nr:uncharacterized protein BCN122_II1189 [Burkholderia cenocepacia]EPZ89138.1 hypothetical protein BURCENK562V_C3212 [Burkholderia cenocepacia K56-2Valvano]ERI32234.1 hypothetical protein BURCENBC7_AP3086 [Burkholderia cenocepacia BC7]CDN62853.1 hypothetical protein I35_5017 [Burkholderia cenocepacia H111]